jgi:hypothetical protein
MLDSQKTTKTSALKTLVIFNFKLKWLRNHLH